MSDEEREEMLAQLDELLRVLRSGMASMGRIDAAATRIEKAMAQRQRTALAQIRAADRLSSLLPPEEPE